MAKILQEKEVPNYSKKKFIFFFYFLKFFFFFFLKGKNGELKIEIEVLFPL